jgi:hypothetical protein
MQVLVAGRWSLGCGAAVSLRRRGSSGIAVNGIGRWQDACCPAHHVNDDQALFSSGMKNFGNLLQYLLKIINVDYLQN